MTVMLLATPSDPRDPQVIRWRVGPGLVRTTGEVSTAELPLAVRTLVTTGVLASVTVAPGLISTRLGADRDARTDGPTVREALFSVLAAPGGWPDAAAAPTDPHWAVREGADRELTEQIRTILDGEFGMYTASHGGAVELVGVQDGIVTVRLAGRCHGCAAAEVTLRGNLELRLAPLPAFRELRTVGERPRCESGGRTFLGLTPRLRAH